MKESEYLMQIQKKNPETSREKSGNFRIIFSEEKIILSYAYVRGKKIHSVMKSEDLMKIRIIRKNPETRKNPEKFTIISYLPSKLSIM